MMNRQTSIAYIDFLTVCKILFMMVAAILMVQVVTISHGQVESKAEFIALMEWPDKSVSDVDLWIKGPNGDMIFFKNKEQGILTLDRDDRGALLGAATLADGSVIMDPHRREMASIRGIMPGEYTVNVVMYSMSSQDPSPVPVHVQIIKLNPYSVVADRVIDMTNTTEEDTVAVFTVDENGKVISTQTDVKRGLVR